jgi:cytoskeletal protein RodZ
MLWREKIYGLLYNCFRLRCVSCRVQCYQRYLNFFNLKLTFQVEISDNVLGKKSSSGLSSANLAIILVIVIGVTAILLTITAKYARRKYRKHRISRDSEASVSIPMKESREIKTEASSQTQSKIKTVTGIQILEKIGTGSTSEGNSF